MTLRHDRTWGHAARPTRPPLLARKWLLPAILAAFAALAAGHMVADAIARAAHDAARFGEWQG